jgi:hypothetical protein
MIEDRKAELRAEIARREHELARLDALPDFDALADGTVAALMVTLGRSQPYTFIGFKTRGQWYLTGKRSPNGVTSDELAGWLETGGRRLETWAVVAEIETVAVSAAAVNLGALLSGAFAGALREDRNGGLIAADEEAFPGARVPRYRDVCMVPDCGCSGRSHP